MRLRSLFTLSLTLLATQPHLRAAAPADASSGQPPLVDIVELCRGDGAVRAPRLAKSPTLVLWNERNSGARFGRIQTMPAERE